MLIALLIAPGVDLAAVLLSNTNDDDGGCDERFEIWDFS
jgi:hypothetical protein